MITSVVFVSRQHFEAGRYPEADAVISIGDPGQAVPAALSEFEHALRLEFYDYVAEQAWKYGVAVDQCFTEEQALRVVVFIARLDAKDAPVSLCVHCEAGNSRSAAVALAARAYAELPAFGEEAAFANPHVVALMEEMLGHRIEIPRMSPDQKLASGLWG